MNNHETIFLRFFSVKLNKNNFLSIQEFIVNFDELSL